MSVPTSPTRRNARYTPLAADGPAPLDMLRAIGQIRSDSLGFLRHCVDTYGDLVAFPIPNRPVLLVNDPDGVRRVLLARHADYGKATVQYSSLALVTGVGLLTAEQAQWKPRRAIVHPAFHNSVFPSVAASAANAAGALRAEFDAASEHHTDAEPAVLRAMLAVVADTLFDTDLDEVSEPGEDLGRGLVEAVDKALHLVIARAQLPLPGALAFLTFPRRLRLARAIERIDVACGRIVAARRDRGLGEADADVLALLLRAQDDGLLDAGQVRDEMVTMVIAGHETVASALTWTLYLLSRHPQVQDRLAAELDSVLGATAAATGPTRPAQWDDLPALGYTRAVLDEALRLYPPAWVITRTALVDGDVAGVAVPAGTLMIISPWLVHRRSQVWPEPDRFDPHRFLAAADGGRSAFSNRPSVDYLPFGLGPRLCIGREFALIEGVLVLAGLLHGRRVLPGSPDAGEVGVNAMITMRPRGGMPLRIVPR